MVTLNQINSLIKAKAESHAQVKTYIGFDEDWMAGDDSNTQYPIINAMIQPSAISQSTNTINFTIRLASADRQQNGVRDLVEVLSDRLLVLNDLLAMLRRELAGQVIISNDVQITHFTDFTDDECAGWYGDFIFQVPNPADYCAIPKN